MDLTYSVITACLNSSDYISRAINSVLIQKHLPKEYIFVDGGSTDGTIEIIENTIENIKSNKTDIDCRLIHQKRGGGISNAWNIGLEKISSDIVFILNSDDWYEANTAEIVINKFISNPKIGIVCGHAKVYSPCTKRTVFIRKNRPLFLFPFLMPLVHCATFVKNDVYKKIGKFDERYKIAADYDFFYRCYLNNVHFLPINSILANFQLGGFGDSNRKISRIETFEVANQYFRHKTLLKLVLFLRAVLGK